MAKPTRTYVAKQVLIAAGNHSVTGYADDSFITITKNGDGITKKVGCDGEVVRAIDPDNSYQVKISLLQTSPSNAFFQQRFILDYDTGEGTFPLLIKDLKGGVVFSAEAAWVIKPADRTYGRDSNNREWTIDTGEAAVTEEGWR